MTASMPSSSPPWPTAPSIRSPPLRRSLAAKMCLEGASVAGDSLYFFAPAVSAGSWITQNRDFYTVIGNHHFYR